MPYALPECVQIELHSIAPDGQVTRRAVPLIEDGEEPTPVELHDAMPARDFFAPLEQSKEAIAAALDGIQAGGRAMRSAAHR